MDRVVRFGSGYDLVSLRFRCLVNMRALAYGEGGAGQRPGEKGPLGTERFVLVRECFLRRPQANNSAWIPDVQQTAV